MSTSDYKIVLTHAARAWCAAHAWPAALEARVRGEVALEGINVNRLVFHTFEWDKDNPQEFVCTPDGDNILKVDTCTRDDLTKLTEGPFKGAIVRVPVPDDD